MGADRPLMSFRVFRVFRGSVMIAKHRTGNNCRGFEWGGSTIHAADTISIGTDAGRVRHVPPRLEATARRRPTVINRTMLSIIPTPDRVFLGDHSD